jgi:hypothetical protein
MTQAPRNKKFFDSNKGSHPAERRAKEKLKVESLKFNFES